MIKYVDGIFIGTTSGEAEVGAIGDFLGAVLSHENWCPGTPFLHDLSELDTALLTVGDIKGIANQAGEQREQFGKGKIALFARRNIEFGLARMLCVFVEDVLDSEFCVFRSRQKALAWLAASQSPPAATSTKTSH